MEKRDARLLRPVSSVEQNGNIVELEFHQRMRRKIHWLIQATQKAQFSRSETLHLLQQGVTTFGKRFSTQLVRSLDREDPEERQALIWLLTVLNDKETIPHLQQIKHQSQVSRQVRLAAALTLAGLGVIQEQRSPSPSTHARPTIKLSAII